MTEPIYMYGRLDSFAVRILEEGRPPREIDTGPVRVLGTGMNSVQVEWLSGQDTGKRLLHTVTGETHDVTRYGRGHRWDVVAGQVVQNGLVYSRIQDGGRRVATLLEADGAHGTHQLDQDTLWRWFGPIWIDECYRNYRLGFAEGLTVYTHQNIAAIAGPGRPVRKVRFRSGEVKVYNGHLLHVRQRLGFPYEIVTAHDVSGRRRGALSVQYVGPWRLYPLCIVTREVLQLIELLTRRWRAGTVR